MGSGNVSDMETLANQYPIDKITISALRGPGDSSLLDENFITEEMMNTLKRNHPDLFTGLTSIVRTLTDGDPTPAKAWKLARTSGFSLQRVYALKPKPKAYDGSDRTKMFNELS